MTDIDTDLIEKDFVLVGEVELEKAGSKTDEWLIKGHASVEIPDLDEEILVVKGMDIEFLEKSGVINWNHNKAPQFVVGEITKAEKLLDKNPAILYTEGLLYKGQEMAQHVHKLMKSLENTNGKLKMRKSIEGKALVREGKKIIKSRITGVALTLQPINSLTYAVLSKGLCKHPESKLCLACDSDCIEKALTVESGQALISESLEGCQCKGGGCESKKKKKKEEEIKAYKEMQEVHKNQMTKSEAVEFLISKGYAPVVANQAVGFIFKHGIVQH